MADDLRRAYVERLTLLDLAKAALERETADALSTLDHVDRLSFRVKGPDSFVAKVLDPGNDPPYRHPLVEIEDQIAGRIIVFFLADIPLVLQRLTGTFSTVERSRRRPPRDEEFGYESEHLICLIPPQLKPPDWTRRDDMPNTFELQIRTIFMHAYAEPQHDISYKSATELPAHVRRELAWIAASAWGADQAYDRVRTWRESAAQITAGDTEPPTS